ncbi:MAG: hypothetical protein LKI32_10480 [Lachnospiraceae bacterium]|jgi:uncharacterized membrane protein|uniref:hypothetical protein n=1 Tax=Clostridium sp. (strain SY8519) TaxID=1042156 RepID=UPI00021721A8|nr:hypothetical protein [Clostridium sp. SY8519]MCI1655780.1 hypothetical protein [Lachnospiraceae bacterium]MCI1657959.1 hypothetical protein [Lachnospiraceae bacterium]BAK46286.1 hypothetical protein CXIVA_03190 [Clostridium sp. SY8519]
MSILFSVWNHLVGFFGTVFVLFAVISLVLILLEILHYRTGHSHRRSRKES